MMLGDNILIEVVGFFISLVLIPAFSSYLIYRRLSIGKVVMSIPCYTFKFMRFYPVFLLIVVVMVGWYQVYTTGDFFEAVDDAMLFCSVLFFWGSLLFYFRHGLSEDCLIVAKSAYFLHVPWGRITDYSVREVGRFRVYVFFFIVTAKSKGGGKKVTRKRDVTIKVRRKDVVLFDRYIVEKVDRRFNRSLEGHPFFTPKRTGD